LVSIDRRQMLPRTAEVEKLIDDDHGARFISNLAGRMDLSLFYAQIATGGGSRAEGQQYRPALADRSVPVRLEPGYQFGRQTAGQYDMSRVPVAVRAGGDQSLHAVRFPLEFTAGLV
jgi:hypothetical protein